MKYYYHFTFEKYYDEMLKDGYIKPGVHRNYLPYDEVTQIGQVDDNPNYSNYIYLGKSIRGLSWFIADIHESGLDTLNKKLILEQITWEQYKKEMNDLGEIIILRIPATLIDEKYLIEDFNSTKSGKTYAYPFNIPIKDIKVLECNII